MTLAPAGPPGLLALEDGSVFEGRGFGAQGTVTGEVCFNTSMTGYQEIATDPSYAGQIVALTAPHIGNTGTNREDDQSSKPWVAGLVVRATSDAYSSWRANSSLAGYLDRHGVVAVSGVDTRRLTRHIRTRGAMRAALSSEDRVADELVDVARAAPPYEGRDLVAEVTTRSPYVVPASSSNAPATTRRVAAFDFGMKNNILGALARAGFEVTVLPASTPADSVTAGGFDAVFLSNGPGDPEPLEHATSTVRALLGRLPIFGICLGHQVLARALGASTFKLHFGHRAANHPVRCLGDGRVAITSQNHGFAVAEPSLADSGAHVTHVNLNDGTVEGIEVPGVARGIQYHPEGGPGPHDSLELFGAFHDLISSFREVEVELAPELEASI